MAVIPGKKIVKPGITGITRFYWILAFGNYFFNPVICNLGILSSRAAPRKNQGPVVALEPTISRQPWPPPMPPTEPFRQHPGHENIPIDSHSPILRYYAAIIFFWWLLFGRWSSYAVSNICHEIPTTVDNNIGLNEGDRG